MRLTCRQWRTSYDPELNKPGKQSQGKVGSKVEYEIHSLKFYKFDEELQEFMQEDQILYDISDKFLNIESGSFTNEFFVTKNEHTYYYKKDAENHGF